jgi:hypothetical protein
MGINGTGCFALIVLEKVPVADERNGCKIGKGEGLSSLGCIPCQEVIEGMAVGTDRMA